MALLLDLYLRRRPQAVAPDDPDLVALSALLSDRLGAAGETISPQRSPEGLHARVSSIRNLEAASLGAARWTRSPRLDISEWTHCLTCSCRPAVAPCRRPTPA